MVRVLGIDPSTAATGLAFPDGSYATIKATAGPDDEARRLHQLYAGFFRALKSPAIDVAVMEGVMSTGGSQGLARKQLSFLGGVLRLALFELSIPYVEVHPSTLKKYATEKGTATKEEMMKWARNEGWLVRNHDEADAAWLKRIGDDWYNLSVNEAAARLTKYQQETLDRLPFPTI